jgi:hypothetical protein
MTPPPNDNVILVPAVSPFATATATPVPAAETPPQIAPFPAGAPSPRSSSSTRPATVTTTEPLDSIPFRMREFLFAHAGTAPFTSRTRGFVQRAV